MAVRFDLQPLRARFERLGQPDAVVSFDKHPWRWALVRYLIGLTLVGYAYFFEGIFLRALGPLGPIGVAVTVLLPVPFVALLVRRERRRRPLQTEPA